MKIGQVKTISTFLGFIEVHRTKKNEYKAEFQDCSFMAKATEEKAAIDFVLTGRFEALRRQTQQEKTCQYQNQQTLTVIMVRPWVEVMQLPTATNSFL